MEILIAGLVLFLGVHSVRIVADGWRTRMLARIGEKPWKLAYTVVSLLGFALMVYGFGQARLAPEWVFVPPPWGRHLNMLLMLFSMILLAASHSPQSHFKAWLHHPMLWSVVLWGAAHLMVRHQKHDAVLFGSLTIWALVCLVSCYARDKRNGTAYGPPVLKKTLITVAAGTGVYLVLVFGLHKLLMGMSPLAGH
jgi:uncharacterized membrane protein